ncbi:hypothetical protein PSCFBP2116_01489 [Pseudomonas syringae]|uniref:Uncharacterized protein n=1 Tax=Pseudomonas syringae TaxID=317 RepID=A0A2K4WYZ6_PSESX|nr:hypothetical protein CFBP3840_04019 [Pseudomonas syringae]SPD81024.1 hypothetical protein PSCFBP2116_01489 [Pseudomonas syringae]
MYPAVLPVAWRIVCTWKAANKKSLSQPNIRWLMTWPKHCMPPLFSKAVMILPLNGPGKGRRLHARYLQQN